MFTDNFKPIFISYPNEASGWNQGVYHERTADIKDLSLDQLKKCSECEAYEIPTLSWTETENTGFGVYNYVDGAGFKMTTGLKDYEFTLTFSNPTKEPMKVSCYANNILKINSEEIAPGDKDHQVTFTLCSVEEDTILQPFVPTDAKEKKDTSLKALFLKDIAVKELPLKAPKHKPTVFLASDSTVQSYDKFHYPQMGWGQVFYRFFNSGKTTEEKQSPDLCYPQNHIYETPNYNIENRSIGARSSRSFINEGKWDRLLALSAPGDFCFIQWGHNDATAVRPNRYVAPADFAYWLKKYIHSCRSRQVVPVLVTPIARRNCDGNNGSFVASFGNYADVMTALAKEENVPIVDLCALSVDYLNQIGPEESKLIYLWAAPGAFPDSAYADGVSDNTHLQEYGATIYAGLVAKAIKSSTNPEFAPLKPFINTEFDIPKPLTYAVAAPADSTAPTGFAMQELNIDNGVASFLLIWNNVEGATKYRVYRKGSVDFQFFPLREVSLEEKNNATVMPFTIPASDVYQIYVVAVLENNKEGASSRIIEFRA